MCAVLVLVLPILVLSLHERDEIHSKPDCSHNLTFSQESIPPQRVVTLKEAAWLQRMSMDTLVLDGVQWDLMEILLLQIFC